MIVRCHRVLVYLHRRRITRRPHRAVCSSVSARTVLEGEVGMTRVVVGWREERSGAAYFHLVLLRRRALDPDRELYPN